MYNKQQNKTKKIKKDVAMFLLGVILSWPSEAEYN